ncbi:SDR family oxidoreductase [Solitalea sp. MAHUQ-68]|uniref:SDR family oxidoreductase n=1 Tax=Solitalea agri TaxID=2953739 RepID=A0A9X2F5L0_9SPHI|nr:SDR family oxidoreductase [Solitalea agri]MCO4292353.1 SDR family oxidoreductase [Solitalea agri]
MKIIVFGASGRTGSQIVKQALNRNFHVTAFARNPYGVHMLHPMLEIIMGDVLDHEKVHEALQGHDIVLSALGFVNPEHRLIGYYNIINAMKDLEIKRLIAVGGMGVLQATADTIIAKTPSFPSQYVSVSESHHKVYEALNNSHLDFTFVCPPNIIQGEKTGNYLVKPDYHPGGMSINSGDLADFMLNEIKDQAFIRKRVGICNAENSITQK